VDAVEAPAGSFNSTARGIVIFVPESRSLTTEGDDPMALATRHRQTPLTPLGRESRLVVRRETNAAVMARLQGRSVEEMERRLAAGHRAYVASWEDAPAAWGWSATRIAEIGELRTTFEVPVGERYLWNFVTLPTHRGLGIYPRLLRAMMEVEGAEAERFWIAFAPENHTSARGIEKAGFTLVAELSFTSAGSPALKEIERGGAELASRLLGIPQAAEVTPCWRCVRAGKSPEQACREGACCCDYQRPEQACA
jgi:ribosomal protein S18 acetylase RimI-like enzyme